MDLSTFLKIFVPATLIICILIIFDSFIKVLTRKIKEDFIYQLIISEIAIFIVVAISLRLINGPVTDYLMFLFIAFSASIVANIPFYFISLVLIKIQKVFQDKEVNGDAGKGFSKKKGEL